MILKMETLKPKEVSKGFSTGKILCKRNIRDKITDKITAERRRNVLEEIIMSDNLSRNIFIDFDSIQQLFVKT